MSKNHVIVIVMLVIILTLSANSLAHNVKDAPHQSYFLGDLKLEHGEVIKDFSISYVTHGKLNTDKSNAILMTSAYLANHHRIDFLIGPGKALDTNKYFIICTDAIGNGLTTSPSNSKKQSGMNFPKFSIGDMVNSQYRLVTEQFGINHLVAVTGASMGGMQSLQWGVSYPDFMDSLIALTPTGRTHGWTAGIMDVVVKTIMMDPAWKNGNYTTNPEDSVRLMTDIIILLTASLPDSLQEEHQKNPHAFLDYMKKFEEKFLGIDANNIIYQSWAIINYNLGNTPGLNGDYYKALRKIKAKTILLTPPLDILVPIEGAIEASKYIEDATYIQIPSIHGHFAATAKDPKDVAFMNKVIRKFLAELED